MWQYCIIVEINFAISRSCSAFGCINRDTKEARKNGLKFHRIPLNSNKLWLNAIKRKDFDLPADACIWSILYQVRETLSLRPCEYAEVLATID